jgi:hypothetical protein
MFNKNPTQNVTIGSTGQSGGITAHTVNIGSLPRQLDVPMSQQLLQALPKAKPVTVTAVMGDQEAFAFANQILSFLKSQGYAVEGVNQAVYSQPIHGQWVNPSATGFDIIVGGR